jgi:hypothetical protein
MILTIDKLQAAKGQLREAIRLWFNEGDPVAVHCLVCSAHQIIHDLNSKQRWRDLLYDSLVIKDEFRKEWIRLIKNPYNFLKHADRDPDGIVNLDTELTEFFIIFSLLGLELLGQQHDETEGAYIVYFAVNRPSLLTEKGKKKFLGHLSSEAVQQVNKLRKRDFFRAYTALRRALAQTESVGAHNSHCRSFSGRK